MEVPTPLWLILGSILFHSCCYHISKLFLVKWVCRRFLFRSVSLKCDQGEQDHTISSSRNHHGTKKLVTDGDVAAVSVELVAICIGAFTGMMGIYIMYETRYDSVYSRSSVLVPCCHVAAWYLIVDFYNMYDAYYLRNNISHLSPSQKLYSFCKARWAYVLHHCFLFLFGYLGIVVSNLRSHKGDFYIASFLIEDLTNPLLSGAKALRLLGQEKSPLYIFNGYVMVIAFFVFRILNVPFDVVVYAAQYHNWNIWKALLHLKLVCYVSIATMLVFQVYWLIAIVKLALRQLKANRKSVVKDKSN